MKTIVDAIFKLASLKRIHSPECDLERVTKARRCTCGSDRDNAIIDELIEFLKTKVYLKNGAKKEKH